MSSHASASLASLRLPAELPCLVCKKVCQCKKCSNCSNSWYCSRECQRTDWNAHKTVCQSIQKLRAWSRFIEYLGGQFSQSDDQTFHQCPRDLNQLPILPHLVLGTLKRGASVDAVLLETWTATGEQSEQIPIFIFSQDKQFVTDQRIISLSFNAVLCGHTLEEAIRLQLPVAIKRLYLSSSNIFRLPSFELVQEGLVPNDFLFVLPKS